jgi:hypothetical protein
VGAENPGCHNFHKPNMSSANPAYMVVAPVAHSLWKRTGGAGAAGQQSGGCTFLVESSVDADGSAGVRSKYGAPDTIWTEVTVGGGTGAAGPTASVDLKLTVSAASLKGIFIHSVYTYV